MNPESRQRLRRRKVCGCQIFCEPTNHLESIYGRTPIPCHCPEKDSYMSAACRSSTVGRSATTTRSLFNHIRLSAVHATGSVQSDISI